jgi:hypothetical protein
MALNDTGYDPTRWASLAVREGISLLSRELLNVGSYERFTCFKYNRETLMFYCEMKLRWIKKQNNLQYKKYVG